MSTNFDIKPTHTGSQPLRVIASIIVGVGAVWLTWLRFNYLTSQEDMYWYGWVQLAGLALVSIFSFWAAVLFIAGKPSAQPVLKVGLSIIPILLFTNLMILVFRGIQNIFQGNAEFFWERLAAQPYKAVLVLVIVIALAVLSSLNKEEKQ